MVWWWNLRIWRFSRDSFRTILVIGFEVLKLLDFWNIGILECWCLHLGLEIDMVFFFWERGFGAKRDYDSMAWFMLIGNAGALWT